MYIYRRVFVYIGTNLKTDLSKKKIVCEKELLNGNVAIAL